MAAEAGPGAPWATTGPYGAPSTLPPTLQDPGSTTVPVAPVSWSRTDSALAGADQPRAGRSRRSLVIVLVVMLVVGLLGAGVAALLTQSSNPQNAAALLRQSLRAAQDAGSFRYVSQSTSDGTTQKTVGNAGADKGTQDIVVGSQKFNVLVIGAACYFQGNAIAMEDELDVSKSVATAHAQQWISLKSSDEPYAAVYAAVTASSALADNIGFKAQHDLGRSTVDGQDVEAISGALTSIPSAGETGIKGTGTMYVRASAPHLPVKYTETGTSSGQKLTFTMTFSQWRETFAATTPPSAVTYVALGGATGGGSSTTPSGPGPTVLA